MQKLYVRVLTPEIPLPNFLIIPFPRVFLAEDTTVRPLGFRLSLHDDRWALHHNPET